MTSDDPATWDDEAVRVVPHDPGWAALFEAEALVIRSVIEPWITGGLHHVGSTAVPGLAAKPVVDIAVGVQSLEASRPCIELLREIHYRHSPYRADVMHWLCKPDPARRTHHLHLIPTGSTRLEDEIALRDYLRVHPDRAAAYAALKQRLADEHPHDRKEYTRGKAEHVEAIIVRARAWRAGQTRQLGAWTPRVAR